MKAEIDHLFTTREEKPLFYIESGSRLWGIDSPDSDFDVRGFHLQSKQQYFDFRKHRDIIEVMDGDFDFVSYDIDKMFGLLVKSNPTVLEWIRAHIIYYNELPDWSVFQSDVVQNFDFKALFHHYLSLAKGSIQLIETDRKFTYKKVFYCIRGLLSADLARQQIIPELLMDNLFNQFATDSDLAVIAKHSLERKKQQVEKTEVLDSEKAHILTTINQFIAQLETKVPESSNNKANLERILRDYSYNIKTEFYK